MFQLKFSILFVGLKFFSHLSILTCPNKNRMMINKYFLTILRLSTPVGMLSIMRFSITIFPGRVFDFPLQGESVLPPKGRRGSDSCEVNSDPPSTHLLMAFICPPNLSYSLCPTGAQAAPPLAHLQRDHPLHGERDRDGVS